MVKSLDDLKRAREEDKRKADSYSKRQFILSLKDADAAKIRFLYDLVQRVEVSKHDFFDNDNKANSVQAVCAKDYGVPCHWCEQAESNKKLVPLPYVALPAYVHVLRNPYMKPEHKSFYEDQAGQLRIILMRRGQVKTGDLVGTLLDYEEDAGSIRGCDFKYSRSGASKDTQYSLTPLAPTAFSVSIPIPSEEEVRALIAEALPYRVANTGVIQDDDPF